MQFTILDRARWKLLPLLAAPLVLISCGVSNTRLEKAEETYPPPTPDFSTLPTAHPPEPIEFMSEAGQFTVRFPCCDLARGHILDHIAEEGFQAQVIECHVTALGEDGASWKVEYCDLPQYVAASSTPEIILDWAQDDGLQDARAHLSEEYPISGQFEVMVEGRELFGQANMRGLGIDGTYKARLYVVDSRLYRVTARVYNENWGNRLAMIDAFLDSFFIHSALSIPFEPTPTSE